MCPLNLSEFDFTLHMLGEGIYAIILSAVALDMDEEKDMAQT